MRMMQWWEKDSRPSVSVEDVMRLDGIMKEVRAEFALRLSLPDPPKILLTTDCFYEEVLRRFYKKKLED